MFFNLSSSKLSDAGYDIFKVSFRNDIISVYIQMVADIAILFDILNPADMGWITKCHHRMQLLILRQSKQLRKLLPVARAYDTASDPMIPRCQRHIRNRQPGVRIYMLGW